MCTQLPIDLFIKIFQYLDIDSILNCYEVSRLFRNIIQTSESTCYQISLAKNGYMARPAIFYKSSGNLSLLEAHISNWEKLRYSRKDQYELNPRTDMSKLIGGIFARAFKEHYASPYRAFQFIELPSVIMGTEGKEWAFADVGVDFVEFTMCPEQDLLALIVQTLNKTDNSTPTQIVHIRSLRENKVHPRAAGDGILSYVIKCSTTLIDLNFYIEVLEDVLGLYIRPDAVKGDISGELIVWNWVTGSILAVLTATANCHEFGSFTFIDSSRLLISAYGLREASIEIWDIQGPHSVATFEMPALVAWRASIHSMRFRSSNNVIPPATSFYPAQMSRLVVGSLRTLVFENGEHFEHSFRIYFRLSDILKCRGKSRFTWDEWGPMNCRFYSQSPGRGCVFGEKLVTKSGFRGKYVTLLDFSRNKVIGKGVERLMPKSPMELPSPEVEDWPSSESYLVDEETNVEMPNVFKRPVRSKLTFRSITAGWSVPFHNHLMIDNERILVLTEEKLHILTFS